MELCFDGDPFWIQLRCHAHLLWQKKQCFKVFLPGKQKKIVLRRNRVARLKTKW